MKLCLKFISVAENFSFFKLKGSAKNKVSRNAFSRFQGRLLFYSFGKRLDQGFLRCRVVSMSISVFRTRTMTATFWVFVCSWTVAIYRAITYPNVFTSKTQERKFALDPTLSIYNCTREPLRASLVLIK